MDTATRFEAPLPNAQRLPYIKLTKKGEKAIRDRHIIGAENFYLLLVAEDF